MMPDKRNYWYQGGYWREYDQYAREHDGRLADALHAASGTQFVTGVHGRLSRLSQWEPRWQTAPDERVVAVDVFLKR